MNHHDKTETVPIGVLADFCSIHADSVQVDSYLQQLAQVNVRCERLENRVALLDAEVRMLKGESGIQQPIVDAPTNPSDEKLVQWMPAIYRNFWMKVSPQEFAMMAGLHDIPSIASPFPEPTPQIIEFVKRQILNLSEIERTELLMFCTQIPFQLEVRPQMRELFEGRY